MRIIEYEYRNPGEDQWHFERVRFRRVNLLVGDSGTGKTRFLNTLFHLGTSAANRKADILQGKWNVLFEHGGQRYRWQLEVENRFPEGNLVTKDYIWVVNEFGDERPLVERTLDSFRLAGREMPRLAQNQTSILLLQDEDALKPLQEAFGSMMRRRFSQDELIRVAEYEVLGNQFLRYIQQEHSLKVVFGAGLGLNARLFLLQRFFPELYKSIVRQFQDIFPFVTSTRVSDKPERRKDDALTGIVPAFSVKEKRISKWIELGEMASGMQKVLLILTDIHMLPETGVYLVDEYENSLGISAIDFLPSLLYNLKLEHQYFITSHHPYLINNIPVKDWYVMHRRGSVVSMKYGDELTERYGKSKQEAFIQLINDPFYKDGVEE